MHIGIAGPLAPELLDDSALRVPPTLEVYHFALLSLLANELAGRGHHITLFGLELEGANPRTFAGERMTLALAPMRKRGRDRALDLFRAERNGLTALMKSSRCDVIHAHWTYEFALSAMDSGIPTVVTAHDLPIGNIVQYRHLYWAIRAMMAARVLRNAQNLTAVSPIVSEHIYRWYRRSGRIDVVPNGLPDWVFDSYLDRQPNTSTVARFATVLQGWDRRKNGRAALEAFAEVRARRIESTLTMFGSGYEPSGPAARWAEEHELTEGVEFVGRLPYRTLLTRLANEVDILVHPSLQESMPMTIIEGMALGLAVIGGVDSGGVGWAMPEGCGLLTDVSSPERLASSMAQLADDEDYRCAIGRSGRQRALALFRITRVVDQYLDVYASAIRSARS